MKRPMKSRIDGASFVSHSWKMERRLGCTRWQSHITLSLGPKRSSCELICQFIRQRNSHWVTRPSEIADIYSSFSPTLPPLSLSFYALLLVVGRSRIPSWSCSTTLSSEISATTTLRNKRRAFLSRDVRGELVIGGGSKFDEIRTITSFFPSLKEPWNWKGSLSRCRREGCPFSPTRGRNQGGSSRFARKRFTLWAGSWILVRSARVESSFIPRSSEEFRFLLVYPMSYLYERSDLFSVYL